MPEGSIKKLANKYFGFTQAATHWSTRTIAKAVGVSKDAVQRVWAAHGLKPHRVKTFKVPNDPQFAEKLVDIVGLCMKSAV